MLPQSPSTVADLRGLNQELAGLSLDNLLRWARAEYGAGLVQVTSLGPTGMVILDHLMRIAPDVRVVTVDTGFLFAETYELIQATEQRYGLTLEVHRSPLSPVTQTELYGPRLWEHDPDACCHERKVKPLAAALTGARAWISGLRRDQSSGRAATPLIDWDTRHGMVKLNPLATWNASRVWAYIHAHDLPYNRLHDQGYASVGCTHCTRAASTATDERSGRWQQGAKTECGLHISARPWGACPE